MMDNPNMAQTSYRSPPGINNYIPMPPDIQRTTNTTTQAPSNIYLPLHSTSTSTSTSIASPYLPDTSRLSHDFLSDIINCDSWAECTNILVHEATAARYKEEMLLGCYNPHSEKPFYNHEALYEGLDDRNYKGVVGARRSASASTSSSGNQTREYERPVSPCSGLAPAPASLSAIGPNATEGLKQDRLPASLYEKRLPTPTLTQGANARETPTTHAQAQRLFSTRLSDEDYNQIMHRATHPTSSKTPELESASASHSSSPYYSSGTPTGLPTATDLLIPGRVNWESSFAQYVLDFHDHLHGIASTRGISVVDAWEVMETERWVWRVEIARLKGIFVNPGKERRGAFSP